MMTERDVVDKFDRYGPVREVRIVRHPATGESRGERRRGSMPALQAAVAISMPPLWRQRSGSAAARACSWHA